MSLLKEILVLPYSAEIHQAYAHSEIAFSRGPEPVVIALRVWFTPLEYTKAVVLEIESPYSTNIEKNLKIAVEQQATTEFGQVFRNPGSPNNRRREMTIQLQSQPMDFGNNFCWTKAKSVPCLH